MGSAIIFSSSAPSTILITPMGWQVVKVIEKIGVKSIENVAPI